MTYIPTVFKSIQQKACVSGANLITAVNQSYTELSNEGYLSSDGTGTVNPSKLGVSLTTSTNIQGTGQGQQRVVVREWIPNFLRQAVYYNTVVIPLTAVTANLATGLTLGSKAYVNFLGFTGTRGPFGGSSLTEAQTMPVLSLGGATVTASVNAAPYAGADGIVTVYFCLVDPT